MLSFQKGMTYVGGPQTVHIHGVVMKRATPLI